VWDPGILLARTSPLPFLLFFFFLLLEPVRTLGGREEVTKKIELQNTAFFFSFLFLITTTSSRSMLEKRETITRPSCKNLSDPSQFSPFAFLLFQLLTIATSIASGNRSSDSGLPTSAKVGWSGSIARDIELQSFVARIFAWKMIARGGRVGRWEEAQRAPGGERIVVVVAVWQWAGGRRRGRQAAVVSARPA
jgi:hypothetical protein